MSVCVFLKKELCYQKRMNRKKALDQTRFPISVYLFINAPNEQGEAISKTSNSDVACIGLDQHLNGYYINRGKRQVLYLVASHSTRLHMR